MSEVLAPRLHVARTKVEIVRERGERAPQAVRPITRKAHAGEGVAEDGSDRVGSGPEGARHAESRKAPCRIQANRRCGKERLVGSEQQHFPKFADPNFQSLNRKVADRKEPGREGLAPFGLHVAGILLQPARVQVQPL